MVNKSPKSRSPVTREALDLLLHAFSQDREAAAAQYELLRERLTKLFVWERCTFAEDYADEVMDRVARRISEGEQIRNVANYALGVARLVLKEARTNASMTTANIDQLRVPVPEPATSEAELQCLDNCLATLEPEQRALLLAYYHGEGRTRMEHRRRLAEELLLDANALRNRALRLRSKLEGCVRNCIEKVDPS